LAVTQQRSAKGQHSAPRGGPPRSWTNDELTKALENVWNRRMTTSQASRVYGIPYNSLLMYVRGKYGKSLKLDKLKETTPAAKDNLNTIGNSRSTPKEKIDSQTGKPAKSKHGSGSSSGSNKSFPVKSSSGDYNQDQQQQTNNPFATAVALGVSLAPALGGAESRIKDVMQQMQTQQAILDHSERLKELEKHMGPEQAKTLMPFFERQFAQQAAQQQVDQHNQQLQHHQQHQDQDGLRSPTSLGSAEEVESITDQDLINQNQENNLAEKERQVQEILIEATKKSEETNQFEVDDNKNKNNNLANANEVLKAIDVKQSEIPAQ
jgi:hypothetical protein